jgi:hypothetical protein
LAAVAYAACNEENVHIFSAHRFDPTRSCLEDPVSIDVINGGSTGNNCSPECLTTTGQCGLPAIFVSTQCPPFPPGYITESQGQVTSAGDPCAAAFAAFNRGASLVDAGGGACLPIAADAGSDVDAGLCPALAEAGAAD